MTRVTGLLVGVLLAVLTAACTPIPDDFGSTPTAGAGSGVVATPGASLGITLGDGGKVTVVGMGETTTEQFELPAGEARMVITACQSNQVMPFITLLHESGASAGLIVDPEKTLKNLAGGKYTISAQANPDCLWQVEITPS